MVYSINCKYLPATLSSGARIKAVYDDKRPMIIPWDHALNFEENLDKACLELIKKLGFFKGSLGQRYLTRGEVKPNERVYTLYSFSNRLEIPKH